MGKAEPDCLLKKLEILIAHELAHCLLGDFNLNWAKLHDEDHDKLTQEIEDYFLKEIIKYSKRVLESNEEEKVFKLGVAIAFDLDTICDPNKAGYVKDEEEKKH
ncbi:8368_t:CDS:2 [Ambispora gerdemannii]|uniref:8368_t:CDS:1 n=1 Tax=Ambispora gerdemannii TaxID=144530 RepID=A0A9N9BVT1_9GLOM|nr:8368_t:CDS:2 [Ambispora gerdemannii]